MCCNVQWTDSTVSAAVPAFLERDETQEASLTNLIGVFKEQTMKIFNAVLCQRRVLFLGYQLPAGEVCSHVVGACLLVSPPLVGYVRLSLTQTCANSLPLTLPSKCGVLLCWCVVCVCVCVSVCVCLCVCVFGSKLIRLVRSLSRSLAAIFCRAASKYF